MGKFKNKKNTKKNMSNAEFKRENFGKWTGAKQKKWVFMNNLHKPNWDEMQLEPLKKNFYKEHPLVSARDEAAVAKHRKQNAISVKGTDCPKPVEAFSECSFSEPVMSALTALGFTHPTAIQSQAIPVALSGRDMVGIAETGSGKTLAYILPAVTHIMEKGPSSQNHGEPDIVVLSPTRELAQQIHEVTKSLKPHVNVTSECFYGGTKRAMQKYSAQKVFEICIATPGRMCDFLFEELVKLNRCTYFVLDEADRMLDMGFEPQIKRIIEQCRPDRQMLMFSATWPPEIQRLAESYLKDYIMVNIGSFQISANHNITQKIEVCDEMDKTSKLVEIVKDVLKEQDHKTLIFVNSKLDVDLLTLKFRLNGWAALGLHGSKKQDERDRVFSDFKKGRIPILIATDLAARGLDVDDIKFIINYDFPLCAEDYVHRIGRTGRCNRTGTAITLFTARDREKTTALISVLEEANQAVDPKLREMLKLPRLPKGEKKRGPKPVELKMRKKQLKRLVGRSQVNLVPLGTQTDANKLPDLNDINPSILADAFRGKKKKQQKKLEPGHQQVIDPPCNYGAPKEQGSLQRFQEKSSLIDFVQQTYGNLIPKKKRKKMGQNLSNSNDPAFMLDLPQNEKIQNLNQFTHERNLECFSQPGIEPGFRPSGVPVFNDYGRQNMGLPMDNRNVKIPADPRSMAVGVGNVAGPWIPQTERPMEPRFMGRPAEDFRNSWNPMGAVHIEPFERNNATMPFLGQNNYPGMNQNNYTGMNQNNYTGMNQSNYSMGGRNAEARRPNSTNNGYLACTDTDWRQQRSIPNQNRFSENNSSSWNRWS